MQTMDPLANSGVSAMAPLGTQPQAAVPAVASPATPGIAGAAGVANNPYAQASDLGLNAVTGNPMNPGFFQAGGGATLALGAIGTIGSLWNSFQQNKLAKQSIGLQKKAFETNLANQTQSYNTALEDRIRARYHTEGRSDKAADTYIERNKL
jgi:hypothetical protein